MFYELMKEKGLTKTELARRMGVSKSNLSNMLNTQPNMTLETIARFELALDATLEFRLVPNIASDSASADEPLSAEG